MLVFYGIASVIAAVVFFTVAKERPPTPPCPPGGEERSLVLDGLKNVFHQIDFILLLIIFFVGLGAFNGVTTWIENIVRPRGFSIT
jgi:Na+/melibiose symporter-like transporter